MSANGIDLANKTLFDALEGYCNYNPTLKNFYEDDQASGPDRSGSNVDLDSGDDKIYTVGETPASMYTGSVVASYEKYKDLALVVITGLAAKGVTCPGTKVTAPER